MTEYQTHAEQGIHLSSTDFPIKYTLTFEHVGQHLIDVSMTFTAQEQQDGCRGAISFVSLLAMSAHYQQHHSPHQTQFMLKKSQKIAGD